MVQPDMPKLSLVSPVKKLGKESELAVPEKKSAGGVSISSQAGLHRLDTRKVVPRG